MVREPRGWKVVQMGQLLAGRQLYRHCRRLFQSAVLVWKATPGWTLVNLLLGVFQGLLPLAALLVMKHIVDIVAATIKDGHSPAMIRLLLLWVALGGGVAILTALCRSLAELASEAQSHLVTDIVTDTLQQQSVAVDLAYYEDNRYFDTLHRAQQEASSRPVSIVNSLLQIVQNGVAFLGIAGVLLAYNWQVALALFLVAFPGAIVRLRYARRSYHMQQQQTEAERRSSYYHVLLTGGAFSKEIRLFELGDIFRQRYQELRQQLRTAKLTLSRRRMQSDLLAQVLASTAICAALGFTALQAVHGVISFGAMVMYYQGFQAAVSYFQSLLRGLAGLYEHSLFQSNYDEFLTLRPTLVAMPPVHVIPRQITEGVRFHDVSFCYPHSTCNALQSIDLEILPNQVIALVGSNGSGKTTLTKLLCRLYDPSAGHISLENIDIRRFAPEEWRRRISVVFQDYVRYHLSAHENIWLGNATGGASVEEVVRAAQAAGADAVIQRLPEGYETQLGHAFFGGHELSIGEWQKVAVARAFLRNARIIVLDEPSSSLDPLAEAELFQRFRTLIQGRSAVLVSHRFSTVQMADCIYVMEQGRIIERGSHQELLRLGGRYAALFQVQAAHYQQAPQRASDTRAHVPE